MSQHATKKDALTGAACAKKCLFRTSASDGHCEVWIYVTIKMNLSVSQTVQLFINISKKACILVPLFPLPRFPPVRFWSCRVFSSCVFSRPTWTMQMFLPHPCGM